LNISYGFLTFGEGRYGGMAIEEKSCWAQMLECLKKLLRSVWLWASGLFQRGE
jgi:hypothetical protein